MLGRHQGSHGRSGVGNCLKLAVATVSVLPKHAAGEGDVPGPVLGVDDEDPAGPDSYVVQVRKRTSGPVDVVQRRPPVLAEFVEGFSHASFTLGARCPVPLVALSTGERVSNCAASGVAGRLLLAQPLDASCTTRRLLFRAESGFHATPDHLRQPRGVQW